MGLSMMPDGKRRRGLEARFAAVLQEDLAGRVLSFDSNAATAAAQITAKLQSMGKPIELRDLFIAGIVNANRATLATRNTKHFAHAGINLANPWSGEV